MQFGNSLGKLEIVTMLPRVSYAEDKDDICIPIQRLEAGDVKLTRRDLDSLFTEGYMLELIFLCLLCVLDMTMNLRTRLHFFMADTADIPY